MPPARRVVTADTAAARRLRDVGLEVILAPPGLSAEALAETVLCEDADGVVMSGPLPSVQVADLVAALEARGAAHVVVATDAASLVYALLSGDQ